MQFGLKKPKEALMGLENHHALVFVRSDLLFKEEGLKTSKRFPAPLYHIEIVLINFLKKNTEALPKKCDPYTNAYKKGKISKSLPAIV